MNISDILKITSHRPWQLPAGQWRYYQEWNNAVFLHWQVSPGIVQALIPGGLQLDTIDGHAWVSVVAFTMEKIRPRNLPALKPISNFHEINLRTYVVKDNKPGVYFLSIEAEKNVSVLIAKSLSGLPYEKANMSRTQEGSLFSYVSRNKLKDFYLELSYQLNNLPYTKTHLDIWLTERYCLYVKENGNLFRYDIHHDAWDINTIDLKKLSVKYRVGDLFIQDQKPDLTYFSGGVKVLAWARQKV